MLWIALALAGGVDRVPEDFPSIQAAVDEGQGEVISVGPGRWAGARVDRPVAIEGRSGAVLDAGVRVGSLDVGLWLVEGARGGDVRGLAFDCDGQLDGALYSGSARGGLARDVVVEGIVAQGCVQGISIVGPAGTRVDGDWMVVGSRFDGARTDALRGGRGGGIGVLAYNVSGVEVVDNGFVGWSDDAVDFASAGVVTVGCGECSVVGNRFGTKGWQWGRASIVDAGSTVRGGLVSVDLVVADNETRDGAWRGFGVRLFGSEGALVENNVGKVWSTAPPGP